MSKILDTTKKLKIVGVFDGTDQYVKSESQDFYKSPSGKMIHLAEELPDGDMWFIKSWRTSSILLYHE